MRRVTGVLGRPRQSPFYASGLSAVFQSDSCAWVKNDMAHTCLTPPPVVGPRRSCTRYRRPPRVESPCRSHTGAPVQAALELCRRKFERCTLFGQPPLRQPKQVALYTSAADLGPSHAHKMVQLAPYVAVVNSDDGIDAPLPSDAAYAHKLREVTVNAPKLKVLGLANGTLLASSPVLMKRRTSSRRNTTLG